MGGGAQGDVQKVDQTKGYAGVCYVAPPKEMACVCNCERELPGSLIPPVGGLEGTPVMRDNHTQAAGTLLP